MVAKSELRRLFNEFYLQLIVLLREPRETENTDFKEISHTCRYINAGIFSFLYLYIDFSKFKKNLLCLLCNKKFILILYTNY